jgi:nitrite reductase/ring-hydroxylating ferredoxin subunit
LIDDYSCTASTANTVPAQAQRKLCDIADIPDGGALELSDNGESLVAMRYGAAVFVYHNICPHAGRPLNWAPGKFLLSQGQLVCAAHGAAFKPENGECIGGPCRGQSLQKAPVQLLDGGVWLVV